MQFTDGEEPPVAFVTGGSGFVGKHLVSTLVDRGFIVRALARSDDSEAVLQDLGAEVVRGDVNDSKALEEGCDGANVVFHLAAKVALDGPLSEHRRIGVEGTKLCLAAAKKGGVSRFVFCSSEQAILGGAVLNNCDETWPYPPNPKGPYAIVKGECERLCKDENDPDSGFTTVIVRPRLIWGLNDTVVLPQFCDAVKTGKWKWIGGGLHKTSTVNVKNCVAGLIFAAENGKPGEVYFITDGKYVVFKDFMTKLIATRGIDASNCGNLPLWLAKFVTIFNYIPAPVPRLFGEECTCNDSKIRELGFENVISIEEGLAELEEEWEAQKDKQQD
eukprot:CAMPEP_0174261122 /NCGR_PEP_ID=MMETSP0439-20130205/11246_1 /TAXON_ID=0 /ORGANISM="Stereomyxa ramosa, Strain Chinc5" /LENGTH=330 /DNA_ID=CAMNT_0015345549 /DNA_START=27 /DNA_END=1019 /DNA_ORIENTATION=-